MLQTQYTPKFKDIRVRRNSETGMYHVTIRMFIGPSWSWVRMIEPTNDYEGLMRNLGITNYQLIHREDGVSYYRNEKEVK